MSECRRVPGELYGRRGVPHLSNAEGSATAMDVAVTSVGRDLYGRPKNRPITDKVIVRNPGCTLLSDTVLFFLAWLLTFGHSLYA